MQWRQWIGLQPRKDDFAALLLALARKAGNRDWTYHAADFSLRSKDSVINLANLYGEYLQTARKDRRGLHPKYLQTMDVANDCVVAKLWTVAQSHIFPLLRSRFEPALLEVMNRLQPPTTAAPRVSVPFVGNLEIVIGYDHGQTVSQVQSGIAADWGIPTQQLVERACANVRSLEIPTWQPHSTGIWQLHSEQGYHDAFLQVPRVFDHLPAHGTPIAMIPNRGLLLATGSDEPGGVHALLSAAQHALLNLPWPLSSELLFVTPEGALALDTPEDCRPLHAAVRNIDMASVYESQKEALQDYCTAVGDDVYVASFGLVRPGDNPDEIVSWCSWAESVPSLLPVTDRIAFVRGQEGNQTSLLVPWPEAQRLVGHYFEATTEDPPRIRVNAFPNPAEWKELEKVGV